MNSMVRGAGLLCLFLTRCGGAPSPDLGKVNPSHGSDDRVHDSAVSESALDGSTNATARHDAGDLGSAPREASANVGAQDAGTDSGFAQQFPSEGGSPVILDVWNAPVPTNLQARCPGYLSQINEGLDSLGAANDFLDLPPGTLETAFEGFLGLDRFFAEGLIEVCSIGDPSLDEIIGMHLQAQIASVISQSWPACSKEDERQAPSSATDLAEQLGVSVEAIGWLLAQPGYDLEAIQQYLRAYSLAPFSLAALAIDVGAYSRKPSETPFFGLPGVERVYHRAGSMVVQIRLPFDHGNPSAGDFVTEVSFNDVLSNAVLPFKAMDPDTPNVLQLWGFRAPEVDKNTSILISGNGIIMYSRFSNTLGWQMPMANEGNWEFLNEEQSAADVHQVIAVLSPVLPGPWVTAADGRRATTALVHRSLYPDDVVGTIVDDPYLGNEGEPRRGLDFLESADAPGCPEAVREEQKALLKNLGALVSSPDASTCLKHYDPEFLIWVAQTFEWAGDNRMGRMGMTLYCGDLHGEDSSLEELEHSLLFAIAASMPWHDWLALRYQDLREWNVETQVRPELVPLIEQAREDLGLATTFEGPWGKTVEYDPTVLDEARARLTSPDSPSLIAFYHEETAFMPWALDLSEAPNSLSVTFPWPRMRQSNVDTLDESIRDSLKALITTWVGEKGIVPEAFDGHVATP